MASGNVASIPPIFPINERSPEARVNSRWLNQILWAFKTEIKITDVPSPTSSRPIYARDMDGVIPSKIDPIPVSKTPKPLILRYP